MQVTKAETFIEGLLEKQLSPSLLYHNKHHTKDVLMAAMELANEEGITDKTDLAILKTAALFHDCGFVNMYEGHEEESCRIAREELPGFDYSQEQITTICSIIMQTKLPSTPITLLEKIMCDADLDYLGRDDFYELGDKLYHELLTLGKLSSRREWDDLQVRFLESHRYYTASAIKKREAPKREYLHELKSAAGIR